MEHLLTDKNSHLQKHLIASPDCKQTCTPSCLTIIDSARDVYSLKLKEATVSIFHVLRQS